MFTTNCATWRFASRFLLIAASWPLLMALSASGTQSQPEPQTEPQPQTVSQMPMIYTQVAAGGMHTCALVNDGTVQCWGMNDKGQLGNTYGNTQATYLEKEKTDQWGFGNTTPVTVKGLTGVTAISAGYEYTCALLGEGTVKCWGNNKWAQLGNGSTTPAYSSTPVTVMGLTGATAISASGSHACALLGGGTVKCWGSNYSGELGNVTETVANSTPVAVQDLTGVTAISAGLDHTCAVLGDGTAQCWGNNRWAQLGNGTEISSKTPVAVQDLTGVIAIGAGGLNTCALLSGGAVKCWGFSKFGSVGKGSDPDYTFSDRLSDLFLHGRMRVGISPYSKTPEAVPSLNGVTAISAGNDHMCVLLSGGTVKCWGENDNGQLGNGTLKGVTAISVGDSHTCALRRDGSIWCWGRNYEGQLGDGTRDKPGAKSRSTPARVRN